MAQTLKKQYVNFLAVVEVDDNISITITGPVFPKDDNAFTKTWFPKTHTSWSLRKPLPLSDLNTLKTMLDTLDNMIAEHLLVEKEKSAAIENTIFELTELGFSDE